jgi:hypothetical protein
MTKLLDELKEYGYEITEETKTTITLYRQQYVDNGYGYYFDADIKLIYDKEKDEVTEITVDGYTEKEIDDLLQKEIAKCLYMKKYDACFESLSDYEELEQDCSDCTYLTMIQNLLQSINEGNW